MLAPMPSLAAAVVNRFRMRPDVITYNLCGAGCAGSLVAVGLAQEMMQVLPLPHRPILPWIGGAH
jgi:3-ketoacyl-CoA synthase